jgi:hypothetical protein
MARSPALLGFVAVFALGCGEDTRPAEAAPPPAQEPAPAPAPAPEADPWTDPIVLAAGISSTHYVPVIVAGKPYEVVDAASGDTLTLTGPDLIEDAAGVPKAYRTGDTAGHALAASKTTGGEPVVLDYAIEWRAETGTLDGTRGAFHVTGVSVHQRGDGPERATFTRDGDRWTRTPAP